MNASNGLHFNAGVQRGLHQDHMVRSCEVEPRCASPSSHADEEHGGGRVIHKALDDVAGSRFKHSTGCDASFGEMSVCSLEEAGIIGKDAELGSVVLRVRSLSLSFFTGDGAHDLIPRSKIAPMASKDPSKTSFSSLQHRSKILFLV